MLPTKFLFIWQSSFRGEDFQKSTNQKQELPVAAIFVNRSGRNQQSLQRTSHVSVHLAKRFQRRRFFRNHPIRNKNCLWWPYLLTDRDEMSNHNRGLSIDASYQVSIHLAKRYGFRGEKSNFFNSFLFFTDFFPLIFKFEKWQWPCLMAVRVIIHGLKENYICIVPLQFGRNIGCLQYLKNLNLKKKKIYFQ